MSQKNENIGTVYWITGLSGAGKTSVGIETERLMKEKKSTVIRLDGDLLREVFKNSDYTYEGRKILGFQYGRLCKMLAHQEMDVIICTIAMFDDVREWNRENIENYVEIYLKVPMEELVRRNQKELYTGAKNGKIRDMYGFDINVELPKNPDLTIENYGDITPLIAAKKILKST